MAAVKVIGSYANSVAIAAGEELQVYAMQYDSITANGTLTKLNGDLSGGTSTFLGLTDTPSSYSGQSGKVVSVKSAEDGLEFKVIPQGTGSENQVVFWNLNNQLKAITGIEYDTGLDALALIGNTIYGDYGETFWSRGYVDIRRQTDNYNPFLTFWRSRQSESGAVQNNDLLGRVSAYGHDGTGWSSGSRVRLNLRAAQNWSSTAHGTKLDVEVTPTGSTTPVTAVTIDQDGIKNERTNTVRTKDYMLTVPGTGTAVLGSGTSGKIAKFSGTNTITDSNVSESALSDHLSQWNLTFINYYGDGEKYYLIATLPPSSLGTYDHLVIEGVFDEEWSSTGKSKFQLLLANRGGFMYRYDLFGPLSYNSRIKAYSQSNGSVNVYAYLADYWCSIQYSILHSFQVTLHLSTTPTTPTGTLVFDSYTYAPRFYAGNGVSIGTSYDAGSGNLYISGSCNADSYIDRTPGYAGDALAEIMRIKNNERGEIDHDTLPEFARKEIQIRELETTTDRQTKEKIKIEKGRDIGAMVTMLTVAVQQLTKRLESLENRLNETK